MFANKTLTQSGTVLILVFLALVGCSDINGPDNPAGEGEEVMKVSLNLQPLNDLGQTVTRVQVLINNGAFSQEMDLDIVGDSATGVFEGLTPGVYEITVNIFAGETLIATGTGEGTVVAGQMTTVTIQMNLESGDLEVIVEWGSNVEVSNVRLTVRGRVDSATNNCECTVGIGPETGQGIMVTFGWYGGGCSTNGYVVKAQGVLLDNQENGCVFTGNWLWVNPGQYYTASLTIDGETASLLVDGIGSSFGTMDYQGLANVLFIGRENDGTWPSCSGAIESVMIEVQGSSGEWVIWDQEDFSNADGFTSTDPDLYIEDGEAHWTVYRNGGEQYLYRSIEPLDLK